MFLQYYVGGSFQISRIYKMHKILHLKKYLSNGKQLDKTNLHTLGEKFIPQYSLEAYLECCETFTMDFFFRKLLAAFSR